MSYIVAILMLGFLIFIHELGHFSMAKLFKMPVKAFAIGLGPTILKKKLGETEYRLALLPLGGYVQIMGEEDKGLPYGFLNQKAWKRFIVLIAGVAFNFITAIILFTFLINIFGSPVRGVEIVNVLDETVASDYIETGDQLLSVNGNNVDDSNYGNITNWISNNQADIVSIELRRDTDIITYEIPLTEIGNEKLLGISYAPSLMFSKAEVDKVNPLIAPFVEFKEGVELILEGLKLIVTGQVTLDDIQGPVGIVDTTSSIVKSDFALFLYWTGLISLNLGIMNLLPIPALDGGQILFLMAEKVVGRKRWNFKVAYIINGLFMLMLLGLMLFITYYDVLDLFNR